MTSYILIWTRGFLREVFKAASACFCLIFFCAALADALLCFDLRLFCRGPKAEGLPLAENFRVKKGRRLGRNVKFTRLQGNLLQNYC